MKLLPWAASAIVVYVLLRQYELDEILQQFQEGASLMIVFWALVATVVSLLLMSTADYLVFRPSLKTLSWSQILRGRGAISVITALSYGAGQGSYGIWLARSSGSSAGKTVGVLAYIMLSDLSAVAILAAVALSISGLPLAPEFEWLAGVLAPAIAGGLLLAGLLGSSVVPKLFRGGKVVGLVSPWSTVPPGAYLLSLLCRITNLVLLITVSWAAARSFGLAVPLVAFLSYLPLVYLVASLPINLGPLGAVQFAWLHFFTSYGSAEQVIAFQILFSTLMSIGWALRGLPFVSRVSRELRAGPRLLASTPAEEDDGCSAKEDAQVEP